MDNLCDSFGPMVSGDGFECHVRRVHSPAAGAGAGGVTPEFDHRPKTRSLAGYLRLNCFLPSPARREVSMGRDTFAISISFSVRQQRTTTHTNFSEKITRECFRVWSW